MQINALYLTRYHLSLKGKKTNTFHYRMTKKR